MKHVSALPQRLREGRVGLGALLPANDFSYDFQAGDVRKEAGRGLGMSLKHAILIGGELLATVSLFEDVVGERQATDQAQGGGKLVLPWVLYARDPGDREHDIPNGARPRCQRRAGE